MDVSNQSRTAMFLHMISTETMELNTFARNVEKATSLKEESALNARFLDVNYAFLPLNALCVFLLKDSIQLESSVLIQSKTV